ncbi:hypothetical protein HED55_00725 [Ochrobactrum haematophilum]|uniref:Uncharacterized protein n=1 Tax=Brucella haematophila TaxID=419474 RepID=A0ABX1DMC0_9HYPH|nr:hypothetical protein [Brucella haematophila]
MSLAIGLTKAEIDQQIATAKLYPRLVSRVTQNILSLVTIDEHSAEECSYALPRGGKPIVGPSIRLAEIIAGQWGNCRVGARVVHVDRVEKFVEAEGIFHDLETNTATTARVRRRISNKNGGLLTDDMIIVTGNAACSIAKRNAILGGVPKAVWRKAYDEAEKVVKGDVKTLAERRENIFKAFAAFGVKPEQIFASLGIAGEDDITLEHIPTLTGMRSALKSGEATVEEMFGGQSKTDGEKKSTSQKMSDFAKGGNGQEKRRRKRPGPTKAKKSKRNRQPRKRPTSPSRKHLATRTPKSFLRRLTISKSHATRGMTHSTTVCPAKHARANSMRRAARRSGTLGLKAMTPQPRKKRRHAIDQRPHPLRKAYG